MKYWLYTEGNILGPYDPAEMLALPAFTEESLICAESATGDNADDWKAAAQVGEISCMLGAGRSVTASVAAGSYRQESALTYSEPGFEENENQTGASYSDLLDSIDKILGTRKEEADPTSPQPVDYELAEKFDIRLSRIQEELEAARWEKNLLLEKMRMKEQEEKKNIARINELEARLKAELRASELAAMCPEPVRQVPDITERPETANKTEEIKKEELALETYLILEPADKATVESPAAPDNKVPEIEVKPLKDVTPSEPIVLKRMHETGADEGVQRPGVDSHVLKSLGQTEPPAYVYGAKAKDPQPSDSPDPEQDEAAATADAGRAAPQAWEAGADVPEVAAKPASAVPQFTIEERQEISVPAPEAAAVRIEPALPEVFAPAPEAATVRIEPALPEVVAPAPEAATVRIEPALPEIIFPAPAPVAARSHSTLPRPVSITPDFVRIQPAAAPAAARTVQPLEFVPISAPQPVYSKPYVFTPSVNQAVSPEASSFSPSAPAAEDVKLPESGSYAGSPDKDPDKVRRLAPEAEEVSKTKVAVPPPSGSGRSTVVVPLKPVKKGGKAAFAVVIIIFGFMAAGGLGYFFLGESVSLSEFSMMSFGSGKKTGSLDAQQEEPGVPGASAQEPLSPQTGAEEQAAPAAATTNTQEPVQQASQAAEKPSKNIRRALEIVKTYKLAGGRGSIESWFVNSFLSGGAGGANEEWTATPLHGDILVVQYRLLRPKQEPMMYQFEVDTVKGEIVRGINNNAIELLDASREKTASATPVKKAVRQPRARKQARPRSLSMLSLPDAPSAGVRQDADPTGFEQPENNDKVKYLKAQESDEELF